MEPKERLLDRLEAISRSVAHHEGALAVFGLGSVGSDLDRLDAYSDVDVLVVVKLGYKQAFLDNLDWLSAIHPIAYAFKVTGYTYKLLYADGIFCEVDILEAPELATHPFAAQRLIWQAPDVELPPLTPPQPRGLVVRTQEWLVGEILTNLYVGLQRYRRGEKLSAFRFVQGYAIDRIIELSPFIEMEQSAHLDPFIHERRYEQRFPQTGHEMSRFMQGYERTPESALAILDFMSRHFAINPAMQQLIMDLLQA